MAQKHIHREDTGCSETMIADMGLCIDVDERLCCGDGSKKIDPKRTSVIAIHWQNDVTKPKGALGDIFAKSVAEVALSSARKR